MIKEVRRKMKHKVNRGQVAQFFREAEKVYHFSFLQDVEVFETWLKSKHYSFGHAIACIRYEQELYDEKVKREQYDNTLWSEKAKKCPKCGTKMGLKPITDPPGPGNEKGYRSMWFCPKGFEKDYPEGLCGYYSYSMTSVNKIFKKIGISYRIRERW